MAQEPLLSGMEPQEGRAEVVESSYRGVSSGHMKQLALVLLFSLSLHAQASHEGRNVFRPGAIPTCELYTVAFTDLTTASTTEAEVLFNLPARGVITGLKVKHSVAFTGTGPLTAMTVSVGDTAPADDVAYTSTFDIFAAVSNALDQDTPFFGSSTFVADDVQANFIATGGNMDDLTAGSVNFMVCWAVLP